MNEPADKNKKAARRSGGAARTGDQD